MSGLKTSGGPVMAIHVGETPGQGRYVQVWQLNAKGPATGKPGPDCMVTMRDRGGAYFTIHDGCPAEWIPLAQAMYRRFSEGSAPKPTHELRWTFGQPHFTSLERDTTDQAVLATGDDSGSES